MTEPRESSWSIGKMLCLLLFLLDSGWATWASAQQPGPEDSAQEASAHPLRVMSFNLRYGTAQDGDNRWEKRRELLTDTIRRFSPDLLGTQETLEFQKRWLDEGLPEHESWGVGRDDGRSQGEMTAVWYRRDRFERLDAGHFWLSEQPERPGSVSWDSSLTRMASWVKLRDRTQPSKAPLLFLNTHFDHRGAEARRMSAILLRDRLRQLGEGCDWIVTGDFNAAEGSPPYQELFPPADSSLRDAFRVAFPRRTSNEGTFNGFDVKSTDGPRIDWVGVSGAWTVRDASIDRTCAGDQLPSDHFPVTAVLER